MLVSIIELLVMLNPFALFLYLEPVRKDLDHRHFVVVIFRASLISLFICLFFLFSGEFLFKKIFMIDFESFRIFGGIIIFSYAYMYIVKGQKALIMIKENLDDMASEIALPFMVGAGTISLTILTSYRHTKVAGIIILALVFIVNFFSIYLLKIARDSLEKNKFKTAYDKNIEVFLRLNGFFIGAIGVNMVFTGIKNMFGLLK
ncbi:MAG: MarC family protein [Candidatus Marinimicrobia bacterium]|nr:MarC family protein [Candidatus Neomarinimicrobiota bacterium]